MAGTRFADLVSLMVRDADQRGERREIEQDLALGRVILVATR